MCLLFPGVPEGQKGKRRQLFQRALSILYVQLLPSTLQTYYQAIKQRWSRGHKARGQEHKKKSEAKDSLSEDRHSRGQGQECPRPRPRTKDTSASALQKKKVFTKIFQAISTKKRFPKNFQALHKILTIQKILLSSSQGQVNLWGLEASMPRPRTSKCVLEGSTSVVKHFNKARVLSTSHKY